MKIDYSKGKIYIITNDYNDHIYIGSTCDTLAKNFSKHKSKMGSEHGPLYKLINDIGFERFRIELICDYPCDDKCQLCQKKSEYIRLYEKTLNLHGEDHKEKRKTKKEQYEKDIQIKIKEDVERKLSKFKDINSTILCECGCEIIKRCLKIHQKTKKHLDFMEKM